MKFNIPILLLTYKKPTALKVLEAILKANPTKIYIASNHWKNEEEKPRIQTLRKQLQEMINQLGGGVEVEFIIKPTHQNAKESISTSITYFFQKEEMGIIFDDDCLPHPSFFPYCKEMLEHYKDTENIFMVSGFSAFDLDKEFKENFQEDYFFSKYGHIWGWGSWRRAWKYYQKEFIDFEKEFQALDVFHSKEEKNCWYKILKRYAKGKIDTWDYPWGYTMWKHKAFSIYPKHNMIANIGFNTPDALHTKAPSKYDNLPTYNFPMPIKHHINITQDIKADLKDFELSYKPAPLIIRAINKAWRLSFGRGKNLFSI